MEQRVSEGRSTVAYNEDLDRRVGEIVALWGDTGRKKMFGGVCYLLHGNMVAGTLRDDLILRLGEADAAEGLKSPGVRLFDLTGRPMKGWIMVAEERLGDEADLRAWLERARSFVASLPPKVRA
jgi:TfoX/Sxy family transcriptional regulator of competence genes